MHDFGCSWSKIPTDSRLWLKEVDSAHAQPGFRGSIKMSLNQTCEVIEVPELADIVLLSEHILFDPAYYLRNNKDVADQRSLSAVEHYLLYGGREGRDPHPLFDSSFYLERNPQVRDQQINPLVHYITKGVLLGLDPHPFFDASFYLKNNPQVADQKIDPLVHYITVGARAGVNPHPLFDCAFYTQQLESSEIGGDFNALVHYLAADARAGIQPSPRFDGEAYLDKNPDVREAGIPPLVHFLRQGVFEGRRGVYPEGATTRQYEQALHKLLEATQSRFTHLIVTSCFQRGGSERCICNFSRAILQDSDRHVVLILVTDLAEVTSGEWLGHDVSTVNLLGIEPSLSEEQRRAILIELLMLRQPEFVIGMNALSFWEALDFHRDRWQGRLESRLIGYLGNYEPFVHENECGFNRGPLNRLIDKLDFFITDNYRLRDAILARHPDNVSLPSKIAVCHKSLEPELHKRLREQSRLSGSKQNCHLAQKVLWAGRLESVKQPEMVGEIARLMPDVHFLVYGRDPLDPRFSWLDNSPNITLCGEFSDFAAIDKKEVSAFLHTSRGDSMPHTIVEAGACGLPIVTSNIGAIDELIDESNGWLVDDSNDPGQFAEKIRYVLDHPDEASRRAFNLQRLIDERHNWPAFQKRVKGSFDMIPEDAQLPSHSFINTYSSSTFDRSLESVLQAPGCDKFNGFNSQFVRANILLYLIRELCIDEFWETGTNVGETSLLIAAQTNIPVASCELNQQFFDLAVRRLKPFADRAEIFHEDSRLFLQRMLKRGTAKRPFIYLDAHWYEDLPLREEIELITASAVECLIVVDDFEVSTDAGFGFDKYGDIALDWAYIGESASKGGLQAFQPAYPSQSETGPRRGFILLTRSQMAADIKRVVPSTLLTEMNLIPECAQLPARCETDCRQHKAQWS